MIVIRKALQMYSQSRIFKSFNFFNLQTDSASYFVNRQYSGDLSIIPVFSNSFFVSRSSLGSSLSFFRDKFRSRYGNYCVLHVKGIGFKVFYFSRYHSLYFLLGYNHLVKFRLPDTIFAKVRKQYVLLFSDSKVDLGRVTYSIRHLRFPDPYRGKGIRYRFQLIKFKPGKQR